MKRANYLLDRIAQPDNIRLAFWKAQRAHSAKAEVAKFRKDLEANIATLRREILCGEVSVGNYYYFTIYDPKERLICAAEFRERVLHHALMNVCHDTFERYQIFDSYACRLNKGTYAAIERAKHYQQSYEWFLKLDVRKYFYNISHVVLKEKLQRQFKEHKLLSIFDAIIDSYEASPDKGIPIGNLTSQYFANHYLAEADHYIKEHLSVPAYVRYMDDMVLWDNDKARLLDVGRQLDTFIDDKLLLELKPFCLNRADKGLPFLGYVLYPHRIKLNRLSCLRFCRKSKSYLQALNCGQWTQAEYQRHILPLLAFARHFT
jgi:hypothetical protein